jgi:hypothetical protein
MPDDSKQMVQFGYIEISREQLSEVCEMFRGPAWRTFERAMMAQRDVEVEAVMSGVGVSQR